MVDGLALRMLAWLCGYILAQTTAGVFVKMDARLVPAFRTVAENALTCMRSCTRYPTCSVYGYRAADRQCILGDEVESQLPNVNPSPTWIYYQWTCEQSMKRFRHSCYFVVQDPLTWDAARRRCTDRGAYLTVLNDNEEYWFVHGLLKGEPEQFWIGASRPASRVPWQWVNADPWTYGTWDSDEQLPDRILHCASIAGSVQMWLKENCESRLWSICEL